MGLEATGNKGLGRSKLKGLNLVPAINKIKKNQKHLKKANLDIKVRPYLFEIHQLVLLFCTFLSGLCHLIKTRVNRANII